MVIVNDGVNEDSVHLSLSLNSYLDEDTSLPNDLAWAESYLNKDLDAFNNDWSSVRNALFEILSSQSEPAENHAQPSMDASLSFSEYVASLTLDRGSDYNEDLICDDFRDFESAEISDDDEGILIIGNRRGGARGKRRCENVFRPNYTENIVKADSNDTDVDPSLTTLEVESSSQDIFKVWDLGISEEQDDFTKQFNVDSNNTGLDLSLTVLELESSSKDIFEVLDLGISKEQDDFTTQFKNGFVDFTVPIQPNPDDSTSWKDMMQVSVDELIAGMDDLSLKQNTR